MARLIVSRLTPYCSANSNSPGSRASTASSPESISACRSSRTCSHSSGGARWLIRLLSAHGFEIAAAVASAPELLEALVEQRPDVGIVDVRLPPTHTDDGLRAALQARAQVPGLPVLVLSQYVEQLYARELLADQAGGVGYLLKDRVFNDEAFTAAIRTVAAGGTVLDPEVVGKLMTRRSRDEPVARLTPREREVLALMAEGRSNAAIGQRLHITDKAVSKHAAGIFTKLDLPLSDDDNRRVLAVLAYLES